MPPKAAVAVNPSRPKREQQGTIFIWVGGKLEFNGVSRYFFRQSNFLYLSPEKLAYERENGRRTF
jgi:hypothetical protein